LTRPGQVCPRVWGPLTSRHSITGTRQKKMVNYRHMVPTFPFGSRVGGFKQPRIPLRTVFMVRSSGPGPPFRRQGRGHGGCYCLVSGSQAPAWEPHWMQSSALRIIPRSNTVLLSHDEVPKQSLSYKCLPKQELGNENWYRRRHGHIEKNANPAIAPIRDP
jgi:hypothetical protein